MFGSDGEGNDFLSNNLTHCKGETHFPEAEPVTQEELDILEVGYSEDLLESVLLPVNIHGVGEPALLDPGAQVCIMHPSVYRRMPEAQRQKLKPMDKWIKSVTGSMVKPEGQAVFKMNLGKGISIRQRFIIVETESPLLLGLNFFKRPEVSWIAGADTIDIKGNTMNCEVVSNEARVWEVRVQGRTVIPPGCETLVPGRITGKPHIMHGVVGPAPDNPSVMSPHYGLGSYQGEQEIRVAHCVVSVQETVPVRVANFGTEPKLLREGTVIGTFQKGVVQESEDYNEEVGIEEVPTHLRDMWEKCAPNLPGSQADTVKSMLRKNQNSFSRSKGDYGKYSQVTHSINTGNAPPRRERPRRLPPEKREACKTKLDEMMEHEVVRPSNSSWAAPIVLVRKKNGDYRFCVDYRWLNSVTIRDSYPIPRMDDCFDTLQGAKWFSTLDLTSGYWQVKVDSKDAHKTAFATPFGLYEFDVMPFGLTNAPATFERMMEKVLSGLHWETCLIYLDDIMVFGASFEQHLERLEEILNRISKAGLKLNPAKCQLFQHSVEFLGHIVSEFGVATCPDKIKAVSEWPIPRCVKEVRGFLGFCGYYRRFVRGFSMIASPLYKLTEIDRKFIWDEDCTEAFQELKSSLTHAPILSFPTPDGQIIVDTDASGYGLGIVISQLQEDQEKVLLYDSVALDRAERNYCVTRRELLAIVTAVKKFHHYFYGRSVKIRTDHKSLNWLMSFKYPEGQLARWLELLGNYDINIEYRPGKDHGNSDGLSRRPCSDCKHCARAEKREEENRAKESDIMGVCSLICGDEDSDTPDVSPWVQERSNEELQALQASDPAITKVCQWLENGERPDGREVIHEGQDVKVLWSMWSQLELVEGVLYRRMPRKSGLQTGLALVAPEALRRETFKFLHSAKWSGHLGVTRTVANIRLRFWWPGMKAQVSRWCEACLMCQQRNDRPGPKRSKLRSDRVGRPMERIAFDILSFPVDTESGNNSVLVVCDYFSKWVEAFPLPDHQAVTVADVLVTELFCRFGTPRFIHSDKAPEFMSELMTEMCALLEVKKTNTPPYRPQSDGLVERFNRTLINMLSKFCTEEQTDWDTHLPYLMCAYRATRNESTGFSPNHLFLGREVTLPIDLMFRNPEEVPYGCHNEYVEWIRGAMTESFHRAREHLKQSAIRQKKNYDHRTQDHEFEVGSLVWRHYKPLTNNKLNRPYTGPYEIVGRPGEVTYTIKRAGSTAEEINVHADHLKKYHHPQAWKNEQWEEQPSFWDTPDIASEESVFESLLNVNAPVFTPASSSQNIDQQAAVFPPKGPNVNDLANDLEVTLPYEDLGALQPISQDLETVSSGKVPITSSPVPIEKNPPLPQRSRPVRKRVLPSKWKDYEYEFL